MLALRAALWPLRPLVLRALLAYLLLRPLLVVLALLLAAFAGEASAQSLQNPLGVVLIAGAVGAADIRRRREAILWQNLGYARLVPPLLFSTVAVLGESVLVWWTR